jgi:hypothetical protein
MTRPFTHFVILGVMRTGSNLLESRLEQYPELICHGELFNPGFIGKSGQLDMFGISVAERDANPTDLLGKMVAQSGSNIPGFRLFDDHDPRVIRHVIRDTACAKIILRRRPIDSYISLKIARETDQWILGGIAKRKSAIITFDAEEYAEYEQRLSAFYSGIERDIREAGQTAFTLIYEDLKSPDMLNGLARYLGTGTPLENFKEPIKRQNPEPLSSKVSNYDALLAYFGARSASALDRTPTPTPTGSAYKLHRIETAHWGFIPIPGNPSTGLDDVLKGAKPLDVAFHDDPPERCTTLICHPYERILRVFETHIMLGPKIFENLRQRLIKNFRLADLDETASPSDIHDSLLAFLHFVDANLAGQTAIKTNEVWRAQSDHIAAINTTAPLSRLLRPADIAGFLETNTGTAKQPARPPRIDPAVIYSEQIETALRKIYAQDYLKLGFSDWTAL